MLEKIKKIIVSLKQSPKFFRNNLAQVVFLIFLAQILFVLGRLPYINIISHYYFYALALLWIVAIFLFKLHITMRMVLIAAIVAFVVAIPFVIIHLDSIADILGFIAYMLLLTYIIREIIVQKKTMR